MRILTAALMAAAAMLALACTDNSDEIDELSGQISTLSEQVSSLEAKVQGMSGASGPGLIDVQLQEWGVIPLNIEKKDGEFTVAAGTYVVNAENIGPIDPHELVIIRTDLDESELLQDDTGFVLEDGEGILKFLGEIEEFDPGGSMSGVFKLTPGRYILFCNVVELEEGEWESHFNEGMRTVLIVE